MPSNDITPSRPVRTTLGDRSIASAILLVVTEIGVFAARELLNYLAYMLRAPVLFCFLSMLGVIVVVLQDVYPHLARATTQSLLWFLPERTHLDRADFIKLYVAVSSGLYLIGIPFRLWFRDRARLSYGSQFTITAIVATLGWGFVLYNLPYLRVAPGTSRLGLSLVFLFFYILTLFAFAAALGFSKLGDLLSKGADKVLRKTACRVQDLREKQGSMLS
jgi:hypothetical protein